MSDRKTLSQWLRDGTVYHDGDPGPAQPNWRDALLADFEHGPPPALRPVAAVPDQPPLRPYHVALMAPGGVVLFLLGWLAGRGALDLGRVATVPPLAWAAVAVAASGAFLLYRGVGWGRER